MSNTVEYTFDDYPNVQVVSYKGANGTLETNLDKILSDLVVGKNKYGHTTVSFDTGINMLKLIVTLFIIIMVIG